MESSIELQVSERVSKAIALARLDLYSLKVFIESEIVDYLQQFPEFSLLEPRLKFSNNSLCDLIEVFNRRCPNYDIHNSVKFLVGQTLQRLEFFLSQTEGLFLDSGLKVSTIGGDFHWGYSRPFKLDVNNVSYVVKPNRGLNTQFLGTLIANLGLDDAISVPKTTNSNSFEIQEFVQSDEKSTCQRELALNYGKLVGFAHYLGLRDYHPENISLRSGRYYLLDNEIVLGAVAPDELFQNKDDPVFSRHLVTSVLDTNLLPIRFPGAHDGQSTAMEATFRYLWDKRKDVLEGYCSLGLMLVSKSDLVREIIESFFDSLKIRAVFRPTLFYSRLLWRRSFTGQYFEQGGVEYGYDILSKLNRYPEDYSVAYNKVVEEEKEQLSKGCIPLFFLNDAYMIPFYGKHNMTRAFSEFQYRLATRDELLLIFALSANAEENEAESHIEETDTIVSRYIGYQNKVLFSNTSEERLRCLSLVYQPASALRIVAPLDLGYYSGLSGVFSVSPEIHSLYSAPILHEALIRLEDGLLGKRKDINLSSGASGMLTTLLLNEQLTEYDINNCLKMIKNSFKSYSIEGGLLDSSNGLIYFLWLLSVIRKNDDALATLSEKPSSETTVSSNLSDYGLAHGVLGQCFLQSLIRLSSKRTCMSDEISKWIRPVSRISSGVHGICRGLDGLALVLAVLNDCYGGLEEIAEEVALKLTLAPKLVNNDLCHGYVGQLWTRERFDWSFGTKTRADFEDTGRTSKLISSALIKLEHRKLTDLSLFNGVCGSLALHRLNHGSYRISSRMHLFPSFIAR